MKRLKNWFVFGLATVAFLAPLKFGTPVIIQASAVMPRDSFEWLHFSWPNELVILFIFAGFIWLVLDRDRMLARVDLLFTLPLFFLLTLMMLAAICVVRFVFGVPFHGSVLLLLGAGSLCILSGISIGTVIATFSKSAQQAQLTSFFINPPLSSLSGALNPVEAMPKWLQPLTVLNPVHHFATIVRGSTLKGSGFLDVWPNFLALLLFTLVLVSLSIWRFRKQLS